jgi:hypothetical protein
MRWCSRVAAALLAAVLLSSSLPSASAADAQKSFAEGQTAYERGDHATALLRFRDAYAASGSPNARFLAAKCLIALGRLPEAYDELVATRSDAAAKADTQPKYRETRDGAASELAALEPKIGKIVIALAEPEGGEVTLNGAAIPKDRLGSPITVLPGAVVIVVKYPGKPPVRREENIIGGQTKTSFFASGGATNTAPDKTNGNNGTAPDDKAKPLPIGTVRVAGFVVAGLGVVGLGVFGVTAGLADSKFNSVVEQCGGKRCTDPGVVATINEGKRLDTIATATFIGGAAAAAVGVALIIVGRPKAPRKSEVRIDASPTGFGVTMISAF